MNDAEFLDALFSDLQTIKEGIGCFAYDTGGWIEVAIDDYDLYRDSDGFKNVANKYRNEFLTLNKKLIFVYCPYSKNAAKRLTDKNYEILKTNSNE